MVVASRALFNVNQVRSPTSQLDSSDNAILDPIKNVSVTLNSFNTTHSYCSYLICNWLTNYISDQNHCTLHFTITSLKLFLDQFPFAGFYMCHLLQLWIKLSDGTVKNTQWTWTSHHYNWKHRIHCNVIFDTYVYGPFRPSRSASKIEQYWITSCLIDNIISPFRRSVSSAILAPHSETISCKVL